MRELQSKGIHSALERNRVPDEMKSCLNYILITLSDKIGGIQISDELGPNKLKTKGMFVFIDANKGCEFLSFG